MRTVEGAAKAWFQAAALALSVAAGGCRGGDRSAAVPCPDLPRVPHLDVAFDPPLGREGTFDLELDVAGAKETCTLTVSGIAGAKPVGGMVQGPTTRTETTCKRADVSGITNEGAIAGLAVGGTARTVKVRVLQAGKPLGEGTFEPDYKPDQCGFVKPRVSLKLAMP
jgi:hypothetical protein